MFELKIKSLQQNEIKILDLSYKEPKTSCKSLNMNLFDDDTDSSESDSDLESNKRLGDADIKKLANALKINTSLEELNLSNNNMGDNGLAQLCEGLLVNANLSLKKLVLSNNQIGVFGAKCLAEVLEAKNSIELIDLSKNNIRDDGIKHISKELPFNRKLKQIILDTNCITDEGAKYLLEAIKHNFTIIKLSLKAYDLKAIKEQLDKDDSLPDITYKPGFNLENKISTELVQKIEGTINDRPCYNFNLFKTETKKPNSEYCDMEIVFTHRL